MTQKMTQKEMFDTYVELLKVLTQPGDTKCREEVLQKLTVDVRML